MSRGAKSDNGVWVGQASRTAGAAGSKALPSVWRHSLAPPARLAMKSSPRPEAPNGSVQSRCGGVPHILAASSIVIGTATSILALRSPIANHAQPPHRHWYASGAGALPPATAHPHPASLSAAQRVLHFFQSRCGACGAYSAEPSAQPESHTHRPPLRKSSSLQASDLDIISCFTIPPY